MKNANVLRQIVAQFFNTKPQNIKLSGEISPNFNINAGSRYWSEMGESYEKIEVFSFSANCEWREIETDNSFSSGSGERYEAPEKPLHEAVKGDELLFAVVTKTCNGTWNDNYSEDTEICLYTAPDFKSTWEKIEAADIERWNDWLRERTQ